MTATHTSGRGVAGYVLFEVVLALTIFASAVLSLASSLNSALETGVNLNRENAIRMGLRSFIEETRRKEIADMATEARDERLDVTYSSTVEDLSLKNKDGTLLNDLYVLHAKASYGEGEAAREETTDLYIYKPQITQSAESSTTATNSGTASAAAGAGNSAQPQPSGGASSRGTSSGASTSGSTTPGGGAASGRIGR